MLTGTDQVQIFALDLVHHGIHFGEGHHALHHVAVHHKGRNDIGEALVDHKVAGISQHSLVQAGNVAQQVVEAVAGNAASSVHIDAVKALHDLGVVRDGEIGHHRLAKALSLHVVGVIGADGHAGVDHLGDGVHDLLNACGKLGLLGLQLCHLVGVGLDGGVVGIDLGLQLGLLGLVGALLQLTEQGAVGLAQLVAGSLQALNFLQALAVLCVLLDDFIHQRELGILELLLDVFLDSIRVVTDKFDIKHDLLSLLYFGSHGAGGPFPMPFKGGVRLRSLCFSSRAGLPSCNLSVGRIRKASIGCQGLSYWATTMTERFNPQPDIALISLQKPSAAHPSRSGRSACPCRRGRPH